jgi:uncharacterized protein YigE (DUF2233 family)
MKKSIFILIISFVPFLAFSQSKKELKKEVVRLKSEVEQGEERIEGFKKETTSYMRQRDSLQNLISGKTVAIKTVEVVDSSKLGNCETELEKYKKEAAKWKKIVADKLPDEIRKEEERIKANAVYKSEVAAQKKWFQQKITTQLAASSNGRTAIKSIDVPSLRTGFDVYVVDMKKNESKVKLYLKDEKGENYSSLGKLNTSLKRSGQKVVFGMNGGMYTPQGLPQGLFIENGIEKAKIDLIQDAYGNFYMQPNGIFLIDTSGNPFVINTKAFEKYRGITKYATQSGPALVLDDVYNPNFNQWSTSRKMRNGVGVTRDGKLVFVISRGNVNLFDFATFFNQILDCPNALYLDGVVSKMYCPELERERREDIGGGFGPIIGVVD